MRAAWLLLAAGMLTVSTGRPARADDCDLGDATCRQLQEAKQNQASANQRLQDIQRSLADAQQKADSTRAYIAQLDGQIAQQQAAIAQTQARLRETERQIRFTQAEIVRREAHLEVRQDLLAQRIRALDKHGRFAWAERGPITQGFGCTDLLGEPYDPGCPARHFHTGIDIGRDFGTPIAAADACVVSYVNYDWGGGYSNFVLITHGNGFATLYAHLSSIAVSGGQGVRRGQVIGAEGSTGYSTGPHLHFEIRLNGAYQNPLSYLA